MATLRQCAIPPQFGTDKRLARYLMQRYDKIGRYAISFDTYSRRIRARTRSHSTFVAEDFEYCMVEDQSTQANSSWAAWIYVHLLRSMGSDGVFAL